MQPEINTTKKTPVYSWGHWQRSTESISHGKQKNLSKDKRRLQQQARTISKRQVRKILDDDL